MSENTNTAGADGVFGSPNEPTPLIGDSGWNKGDSRIAQGLGIVTRFGKPFGSRKKKLRKKRKS